MIANIETVDYIQLERKVDALVSGYKLETKEKDYILLFSREVAGIVFDKLKKNQEKTLAFIKELFDKSAKSCPKISMGCLESNLNEMAWEMERIDGKQILDLLERYRSYSATVPALCDLEASSFFTSIPNVASLLPICNVLTPPKQEPKAIYIDNLREIVVQMKETNRSIAEIMDTEKVPFFVGFCNFFKSKEAKTIVQRNFSAMTGKDILQKGAMLRAYGYLAHPGIQEQLMDIVHEIKDFPSLMVVLKDDSKAMLVIGKIKTQIYPHITMMLETMVKWQEIHSQIGFFESFNSEIKKAEKSVEDELKRFLSIVHTDPFGDHGPMMREESKYKQVSPKYQTITAVIHDWIKLVNDVEIMNDPNDALLLKEQREATKDYLDVLDRKRRDKHISMSDYEKQRYLLEQQLKDIEEKIKKIKVMKKK